MDQHAATMTLPEAPPAWDVPAATLPGWTCSVPPRHVHVAPSLSLGGAERIVAELAQAFAGSGIGADVAVMRDAAAEHALSASGIGVHRLGRLRHRASGP